MGGVARASPTARFLTVCFRCETCGDLPTRESEVRKFLPKKLQGALDKALKDKPKAIMLTFETGCPNCKPNNRHAGGELLALKRRVH